MEGPDGGTIFNIRDLTAFYAKITSFYVQAWRIKLLYLTIFSIGRWIRLKRSTFSLSSAFVSAFYDFGLCVRGSMELRKDCCGT